mgnify:CR=1 FL=1
MTTLLQVIRNRLLPAILTINLARGEFVVLLDHGGEQGLDRLPDGVEAGTDRLAAR